MAWGSPREAAMTKHSEYPGSRSPCPLVGRRHYRKGETVAGRVWACSRSENPDLGHLLSW